MVSLPATIQCTLGITIIKTMRAVHKQCAATSAISGCDESASVGPSNRSAGRLLKNSRPLVVPAYAGIHGRGNIELRIARATPAPDFQKMADPQTPRDVYVSDSNLFSDADFARVRASEVSTGLSLTALWKTTAAGSRFAALQRGEMGAENVFLAVFVGGELINVARLTSTPDITSSERVYVAVPVPPDKAKRIAEAVAIRWPRGGGL
jgi:hypothetical protein